MCTAEAMKEHFQLLETKLLNEIATVRQMIMKGLNLDSTFFAPLGAMEYQTSPIIVPVANSVPLTINPDRVTTAPPVNSPAVIFPMDNQPFKVLKRNKTTRLPELKSLLTPRINHSIPTENRADEIKTMNNTIRRAGESKIFTYFWKLENFSDHVDSSEDEVTSSVFTIANHNLQAIANFHYLGRDFLNIRIEEVSDEYLRQNKKSAISIETSNVDNQNIDIERYFRHKIVVMDHNVPPADIISPIFNDNSAGFSIPLSVFLSQRYSKNDTLLIRVTVYI